MGDDCITIREVGVRDVVIDLGELGLAGRDSRDEPPDGGVRGAAAPHRRPYPPRAVLAAAAVLLLGALASSGHRPAAPDAVVIAARPNDVTFADGDDYFIVSAAGSPAGAQVQNEIVSWYALPSATLVSRTSVAVTGTIRRLAAVDDVLLVSYETDGSGLIATAGYAAGTGHTLWRRYGQLVGPTPTRGVVVLAEDAVAAGTTHRYGVDLRSGWTRWQLDQSQTDVGELLPEGSTGPAMLVTASMGGRIEVRDLRSGTVTAAVTTGIAAGAAGVTFGVAGDLAVLSGPAGTAGYVLPDLRRRWQTEPDLSGSFIVSTCGDVVCTLGGSGGLRVLDPADGRQLWTSDTRSTGQRVGPNLVLTGDRLGTANPLVDARTGQPRANLGAWRPAADTRADGSLLVVREEPRLRRVWYGVLRGGARSVTPFGVADQISGDCRTGGDALVCRRSDASAGVWRFAPS